MSEEKNKTSIEELAKKLEECEKKASEYLAGWQRARADFSNYKREEMERIGEFLKYAGEEFILKILPILDNFEIAIKEIQNPKSPIQNSEEIIKGFSQIKNQFLDFLKNQGAEEIKAVGEKFDPNFMEAAETVEKEGADSGIVVEEIQKGYKINGRLLRPARVKISK